MIRTWSRASEEKLIAEDCPRGAWRGFEWPVKIGSATCTHDCEYGNGYETSDDRLSGHVNCSYKTQTK